MLWGYEMASLPPSATFLLSCYFSPTVLHELCRVRVSFQDIRIARILFLCLQFFKLSLIPLSKGSP